jgi:multiple sugar transport system substrate-binding protein
VTSQSKHVKEAVQFATWLNTNQEAVKALVTQTGIYPADTDAAASALSTAPEFFSNQPDFYKVAAEVAATVKPFTYGPNVNVAFSAYNDDFAKAAQAKSQAAFVQAVEQMQKTTVDDLKKSGFTVK